MTTSGTKRTRKAESDKANKNKKLKADEINKEAAATAAAAVAAAAPVQVILGFQEKELQTKKAAAVANAFLVVPANNKQEDDDDLGNPYEATSKLMMGVVAAKQQAPTPPIKIKSPSTPNKTALNGAGSTPFIMDHHSSPVSMMKRSNSSRTSVPCILLFLVAFFLWCSVTLIGLLLSERLEHQLQMYQMRQVLQKREQVVPNNDNNPPQDNINRWKEMVNKLEWQKKGMMKEFGEKLASLEFTME